MHCEVDLFIQIQLLFQFLFSISTKEQEELGRRGCKLQRGLDEEKVRKSSRNTAELEEQAEQQDLGRQEGILWELDVHWT